jgi:hypothetical protein
MNNPDKLATLGTHHTGQRDKLPKGKAKLIYQQTDKISQPPENWEKRNGPDLVQAFPKKWWIESDFMAPNLSFPLWLEGSDSISLEMPVPSQGHCVFPSFPVVD